MNATDRLEGAYEADAPFARWDAGRDAWWVATAELAVEEMASSSPTFAALRSSSSQGFVTVDGPASTFSRYLVPSAAFKVTMTTMPAGCELFGSSGTTGSRSWVPRDDACLERFLTGTAAVARSLVDADTGAVGVVSLLPSVSTPDAPWMSFVAAGLGTAHRLLHVDGDARRAADAIDALALEGRRSIVIGSPMRLLELADIASAASMRRSVQCISMGGWKRATGEQLEPEVFRRRLAAGLGIEESAVRDAYSMVELNTVLLECARHRKHVPPWLEVVALCPWSARPVADGQEGVLAFFDVSALCYPGFVVAEDAGRLEHDPCPCGIPGPTLDEVRRLSSSEIRGCALTA